jgi:DNA-binding MarR family transcriptional regulator
MDCLLSDKFFSLINSIYNEHKIPKDYGVGGDLYFSETKLIDVIYNNPNINAGEYSNILGITKGALTQLMNKLIQKKLAFSYTKDGNKKEKYYTLTSLGEKARKAHLEHYLQGNKALCQYFSSLNTDDTKVILDFLDKIIKLVPICEFSCSSDADNKKNCMCQEEI